MLLQKIFTKTSLCRGSNMSSSAVTGYVLVYHFNSGRRGVASVEIARMVYYGANIRVHTLYMLYLLAKNDWIWIMNKSVPKFGTIEAVPLTCIQVAMTYSLALRLPWTRFLWLVSQIIMWLSRGLLLTSILQFPSFFFVCVSLFFSLGGGAVVGGRIFSSTPVCTPSLSTFSSETMARGMLGRRKWWPKISRLWSRLSTCTGWERQINRGSHGSVSSLVKESWNPVEVKMWYHQTENCWACYHTWVYFFARNFRFSWGN